MPDETRARARAARGRYGLVACVSGRAPSDARARSSASTSSPTSASTASSSTPEAAAVGDRCSTRSRARTGWPTSSTKPLSVAFHYRSEPDEDEAAAQLERGRRAARSPRASDALGPHGARGAAAGRRLEGNGGPRAARDDGLRARALRGRRHDRPRRRSRRSTGSRSRCASRSCRRKARAELGDGRRPRRRLAGGVPRDCCAGSRDAEALAHRAD